MDIIIGGKKDSEWIKSTVKFSVNKEPFTFEIITNLKHHRYNLDTIIKAWLNDENTKDYRDTSFRDYINSKTHLSGAAALTIKEYEEKFA